MSIRKRTLRSGNTTWLVDYRDSAGKRRAKQFATKREAEIFRDRAGVDIRSGIHVADSASVTVREACRLFNEHCNVAMTRGDLERTTVESYEGLIRLHILHSEIGIGGIKLNGLTLPEVIAFQERLEANRSRAMTRKVLTTLKTVIDHGMRRGLVATNHAAGLRVRRGTSQRGKTRVTVPDKAVVRTLIEMAAGNYEAMTEQEKVLVKRLHRYPFRAMLIVAAFCGLRASELYGLRWQDVDFRTNKLNIRQRIDIYGVAGAVKSEAGEREIPIGPFVCNTLRDLRRRDIMERRNKSIEDRRRLFAGERLVFTNRKGGPLNHHNVRHRFWVPLRARCDANFRWHDLRHFAVSCWIEQGLSPKAVMTYAGHSSITMTFDLYGHLFPAESHHDAMSDAESRVLGF